MNGINKIRDSSTVLKQKGPQLVSLTKFYFKLAIGCSNNTLLLLRKKNVKTNNLEKT